MRRWRGSTSTTTRVSSSRKGTLVEDLTADEHIGFTEDAQVIISRVAAPRIASTACARGSRSSWRGRRARARRRTFTCGATSRKPSATRSSSCPARLPLPRPWTISEAAPFTNGAEDPEYFFNDAEIEKLRAIDLRAALSARDVQWMLLADQSAHGLRQALNARQGSVIVLRP